MMQQVSREVIVAITKKLFTELAALAQVSRERLGGRMMWVRAALTIIQSRNTPVVTRSDLTYPMAGSQMISYLLHRGLGLRYCLYSARNRNSSFAELIRHEFPLTETK